MNPDRNRAIAGMALVLVIVTLAFRATILHQEYAPGAYRLQQYLASGAVGVPFMQTYAFGAFVYLAVRKCYGIVTFTIIAFGLAAVFARPARVRDTIVVLTLVRAGVEVLERLLHHGDTIWESLFDTLSGGTFAAIVGALAYNAFATRSELRASR